MSATPAIFQPALDIVSEPPIRVVIQEDGILLEIDGEQHHLDADEAGQLGCKLLHASRTATNNIEVRIAGN